MGDGGPARQVFGNRSSYVLFWRAFRVVAVFCCQTIILVSNKLCRTEACQLSNEIKSVEVLLDLHDVLLNKNSSSEKPIKHVTASVAHQISAWGLIQCHVLPLCHGVTSQAPAPLSSM